MAFEIPQNLSNNLMGLAWMIGTWRGNGHGVQPGPDGAAGEQFEYGQQIDIVENGGDFLHYHSQIYTTDAKGAPSEPLWSESGYWRPALDGTVEVVMSNPEGWAEVWAGKVEGAKIELVTDAVMRTQGAAVAYTGGQRLYGQVEGDLLWTFDRATTDQPLQPYLWARLQRA